MVDRWMLPGELSRTADPDAPPGRRTPRDWAVDVALFVFAVWIWLGELLYFVNTNVFGLPVWMQVADPVLGGLVCLSLWWRRQFPVAVAVAAGLVSTVCNTSAGALVVLVFSLALHRGWKWAVVVTTGTVLLSVPYLYTYFPRAMDGPVWPWVMSLVLGGALCVTAGLAVRARRKLVLALWQRGEDQRAEHARALEDSRRAERQRIAREMHDVLAHRISLLSVHAGALEYRTAQASRGVAPMPSASEVHEAVAVVRSNANQALEELRDVLDLLREPVSGTAPPQPTVLQLPSLVEEARLSGQEVLADISGGLGSLRPQLQRTVYRIVQEGLTNARKHAPGSAVSVVVSADEDVLVQVANAVGLTASEIPGAGAGLTGLAERVALHGGTLSTTVADGEFRMRARIPCTP